MGWSRARRTWFQHGPAALVALKKELFAGNRDYLAMLVSYFGSEYYHPDTTYLDDFDTTIPLPKDQAPALADKLSHCGGLIR